MNVAEFAFAAENLLGPFPGKAERPRKGTEELNYLSNVVVVFAILGARLRIE